jgi:hypothetical protein
MAEKVSILEKINISEIQVEMLYRRPTASTCVFSTGYLHCIYNLFIIFF